MKYHLRIIILLVLGLWCMSAIAQDEDKAKVDTLDANTIVIKAGNVKVDSAMAHEKRKDSKGANRLYADAIKEYKKLIKKDKEMFAPYYYIAKVQFKTKDYQEAITNYTKAIIIDSTHDDAFRDRGIAEVELSKFDEAKKDFNIALSLNPNDPVTLYNRGKLAERGKDKQLCFEDYEAALDLKPNYPDVLFRRGMLYANVKQDYILAVGDFNKVTELDSSYYIAYFWKGKAYYLGTDYKSANAELSRFLQIDSNSVDALIMRGAARLNYDDYSNAIRDFDDIIKLEPKNFIALANRGLAKGQLKNYNGALEDLDLSIKIKGDYSPAYINRAMVKYMNKDRKGGCADLRKADVLNHPKAYELLQKYCKSEVK